MSTSLDADDAKAETNPPPAPPRPRSSSPAARRTQLTHALNKVAAGAADFEQTLGLDDPESRRDDEGGAGDKDQGVQFDDDGASTTILDDTKKQLEDLQLRTIYTLVEDVQVRVNPHHLLLFQPIGSNPCF